MLIIGKLSLSLLDLDDASKEAFVLLENGGAEVGVLHKIDIFHLGGHGLILGISVDLVEGRQLIDLFFVSQVANVV
jgi:hypothetical protein